MLQIVLCASGQRRDVEFTESGSHTIMYQTGVAGAASGALLAAYRPLLEGLAWRLAHDDDASVGSEDLAQAGALALLIAAGQANPDEPGFPRYARLRVEGAMRDLMRRSRGRGGRSRPQSTLDAAAFETLADPSFTPQQWMEISARDDAIRNALAMLPDRQQTILRLAFDRGMSQHEIADFLAISVSQVARLRAAALKAMRQHLACWLD